MSFNNAVEMYDIREKQMMVSGSSFKFKPFENFYVPIDGDKVYISAPSINYRVPCPIDLIGVLPEAIMLTENKHESYTPVIDAAGFNYTDMSLELYRMPNRMSHDLSRSQICSKVPIYIETVYGNNHDSNKLISHAQWAEAFKCKIDVKNEKILISDTTNQCILYIKIKTYENNTEKMDKTIRNVIENIKNGQAFKIEDVSSINTRLADTNLEVVDANKRAVYTLIHRILLADSDDKLNRRSFDNISRVSVSTTDRTMHLYAGEGDDERSVALCLLTDINNDDEIYEGIDFGNDDNNIWISNNGLTFIRDIETGQIFKAVNGDTLW